MDILHKDFDIREYKLKNFLNLNPYESEMVRKWRNNNNVRKWMFNDNVISKEEHTIFLNSLKETNNKVYWLITKDKDYIGVLSYTRIMWNHRNAYFGIYGNPEEKNFHIGIDIYSLAISVAFDVLNLHTLKSEPLEDNKGVIYLHKKLGFLEEGRLKEFIYKNNEWKDVIIFGMINPRERS